MVRISHLPATGVVGLLGGGLFLCEETMPADGVLTGMQVEVKPDGSQPDCKFVVYKGNTLAYLSPGQTWTGSQNVSRTAVLPDIPVASGAVVRWGFWMPTSANGTLNRRTTSGHRSRYAQGAQPARTLPSTIVANGMALAGYLEYSSSPGGGTTEPPPDTSIPNPTQELEPPTLSGQAKLPPGRYWVGASYTEEGSGLETPVGRLARIVVPGDANGNPTAVPRLILSTLNQRLANAEFLEKDAAGRALDVTAPTLPAGVSVSFGEGEALISAATADAAANDVLVEDPVPVFEEGEGQQAVALGREISTEGHTQGALEVVVRELDGAGAVVPNTTRVLASLSGPGEADADAVLSPAGEEEDGDVVLSAAARSVQVLYRLTPSPGSTGKTLTGRVRNRGHHPGRARPRKREKPPAGSGRPSNPKPRPDRPHPPGSDKGAERPPRPPKPPPLVKQAPPDRPLYDGAAVATHPHSPETTGTSRDVQAQEFPGTRLGVEATGRIASRPASGRARLVELTADGAGHAGYAGEGVLGAAEMAPDGTVYAKAYSADGALVREAAVDRPDVGANRSYDLAASGSGSETGVLSLWRVTGGVRELVFREEDLDWAGCQATGYSAASPGFPVSSVSVTDFGVKHYGDHSADGRGVIQSNLFLPARQPVRDDTGFFGVAGAVLPGATYTDAVEARWKGAGGARLSNPERTPAEVYLVGIGPEEEVELGVLFSALGDSPWQDRSLTYTVPTEEEVPGGIFAKEWRSRGFSGGDFVLQRPAHSRGTEAVRGDRYAAGGELVATLKNGREDGMHERGAKLGARTVELKAPVEEAEGTSTTSFASRSRSIEPWTPEQTDPLLVPENPIVRARISLQASPDRLSSPYVPPGSPRFAWRSVAGLRGEVAILTRADGTEFPGGCVVSGFRRPSALPRRVANTNQDGETVRRSWGKRVGRHGPMVLAVWEQETMLAIENHGWEENFGLEAEDERFVLFFLSAPIFGATGRARRVPGVPSGAARALFAVAEVTGAQIVSSEPLPPVPPPGTGHGSPA